MIYTGRATLEDGRVLTADGTIQEIANWADNIIRVEGGEISIQIVRQK